jgi:hypothetical protein
MPCGGECRELHLHRQRTKVPSKKDRKIMVMPICPAASEDKIVKKQRKDNE